MYKGRPLHPPIFELGLKAYLWGCSAVELALAAERFGQEHGVTVLFTPQIVDVAAVARAASRLLVLCPHLDPVKVGRGSGSVLAEAIKEAGAAGALLNHAERPVPLGPMAGAIRRADAVGLISVVCADSPEEAAAVANLGPNIILAEPPDLIGGARSVAAAKQDFIARAVAAVRRVNPEILVLNSAGIRSPEDAAAVIEAGADGTGSTSGVLTAEQPAGMLGAMIAAVRRAWDRKRGNATSNTGDAVAKTAAAIS